jgi:hypothetical protein
MDNYWMKDEPPIGGPAGMMQTNFPVGFIPKCSVLDLWAIAGLIKGLC